MFSIISHGPVYGDDWPDWQRHLYPFTYQRDAGFIRQEIRLLTVQIARNRDLLARAIKARATDRSQRHLVRNVRGTIDRLERYRRNGLTQIRLIEAATVRVVQ